VVQALTGQLGLRVCDRPFAEVIYVAQRQVWTLDPFDRIIVAQAALGPDILITKDKMMRANYAGGKW
jgi:PIN domain nuclease of toxin-antitoxin system